MQNRELDLTCIISFRTLVTERSYRRSASVLNVSTSTLIRRVRYLERKLGVQLVEKGSNGITRITCDGIVLADCSDVVLSSVESMYQRFHQNAGRCAVLGIVDRCDEYISQDRLVRIAAEMRTANNIATKYVEIRSTDLHRDPTVARAHAVITYQNPGQYFKKFAPILATDLCAIVGPQHQFCNRQSVRLTELMKYPFFHSRYMQEARMSYVGDETRPHFPSASGDLSCVVDQISRTAFATLVPRDFAAKLSNNVHRIELDRSVGICVYVASNEAAGKTLGGKLMSAALTACA